MNISMQPLISDLKFAIAPSIKAIDTRDPDWIFRTLYEVLDTMLVVAQGDMAKDSDLARVFEALSYIIINYRSLRRGGLQGDRYTIALANVASVAVPAAPVGSFNPRRAEAGGEQNRIRFYSGTERSSWNKGSEARNDIEPMWLSNWADYLQLGANPVHPTLGALHLGTAPRPRPLFISWYDRKADWVATNGNPITEHLTNVALNIPPEHYKNSGAAPGFGRFCSALNQMFDNELGEELTASMLDRLTGHFGPAWGSNAFFSIPVAVGVSPRFQDEAIVRETYDLRAVVSVAIAKPWDARLFHAAWEFFSGIANQVLVDLLVTEYAQSMRDFVRTQWEVTQNNTTYFVAHPLKNRLIPVKNGANQIRNVLAPIRAQQPSDEGGDAGVFLTEEQLATLQELANTLHRRADEVEAYAKLLHLMVDILESHRGAEWVRMRPNVAPGQSDRKLCLGHALRTAAARAAAKQNTDRTVTLIGADLFNHSVAPRLTQEPLNKRHADYEEEFLQAIFIELLENSATYGLAKDMRVPVRVLTEQVPDGRVNLVLENIIHPAFADDAVKANGSLLHSKSASGMILAGKMLEHLELGVLRYDARWTGPPGASEAIWQYQLEFAPW